ncbi:MAG: RAD55 family ATPase [Candidatus Bathyarchaeia archaeon]
MMRRVPTGIPNLDPIFDGGFLEGSLILLAGTPGTGKTVFGMEFLRHGAVHLGEPGVFVSFAEGRGTLIENMMSHLGCDRRDFEEIEVLDFVAVKEKGVESIMEIIIRSIDEREARRLVIDSFTAMTNGLEHSIEARILAHVLGRLVKQSGCTTVLIAETPIGTEKVGMGVEEFVADGVIVLSRKVVNGRIIREMDILKLRGTKIESPRHLFTLENGFQVLPKFKFRVPSLRKEFKPLPNTETHFSFGSKDLDRLLGGWKRGTVNLIEVESRIDTRALLGLIFTTGLNFVMHGNGFVTFDPLICNANTIKEYFGPFVGEERLNHLVRCLEVARYPREEREKFVLNLKGENPDEDWEIILEYLRSIGFPKKPVCCFCSLDAVENYYGRENAIRAIYTCGVESTRKTDSLLILSVPSNSEEIRTVSKMAESHLKLEEIDGTAVLFGVKPQTGYRAMEIVASEVSCELKLTPIL